MSLELFNLKGKTAVVIGGTGSIGKAITMGLARVGADVVPVSRRMDQVAETNNALASLGRKCCALTVDIGDKKSIDALMDAVVAEYGKIDILVNAAGVHLRKPSLEITEEEWDKVIDINLKGVFLTSQSAGRYMVRQNSGKIVNIASLGSYVSLFETTPYCASKAGVVMVTKSLATEWAKYHVNVNAIAPGVFRTSLNTKALDDKERADKILISTPMRRFGKVEELVGTAIYLSSSASDFVTGEVIAVDGGFLADGI